MIREIKKALWEKQEVNYPGNIKSLPALFKANNNLFNFKYLLSESQTKKLTNGLPIDKPLELASFYNVLPVSLRHNLSTSIIIQPLSFHEILSLCYSFGLKFTPKKLPKLYYLKAVSKRV